MKSRFTNAMKERIMEERRSGVPIKKLCAKYHVCAKTIRTWITQTSEKGDRNLTCSVRRKKRKGRFPEEVCKTIVARYEAGEAISALCEEINIGRSTLYRWIKLYTEYRRNNGEKFTVLDINRLIEENRMLAEENQVFRSCQCHPSAPLRIKMAEMKKWKDKFTVIQKTQNDILRSIKLSGYFLRNSNIIFVKNNFIIIPSPRHSHQACSSITAYCQSILYLFISKSICCCIKIDIIIAI